MRADPAAVRGFGAEGALEDLLRDLGRHRAGVVDPEDDLPTLVLGAHRDGLALRYGLQRVLDEVPENPSNERGVALERSGGALADDEMALAAYQMIAVQGDHAGHGFGDPHRTWRRREFAPLRGEEFAMGRDLLSDLARHRGQVARHRNATTSRDVEVMAFVQLASVPVRVRRGGAVAVEFDVPVKSVR